VIKETGDISVLTQLCQFGIVNFEVQFKLFSHTRSSLYPFILVKHTSCT
jgi:hypothetical protein